MGRLRRDVIAGLDDVETLTHNLQRECGLDELSRGEPRPEPGTQDDRVVVVVEDPGDRVLGLDLLDVVLGQRHRRRLDDLRGEQRLERFRDGEGHEAGPRSCGGLADEEGRAGVVERPGDDEHLPEQALVPTLRPLREERRGGIVVEDRPGGRPGGGNRATGRSGRARGPSEPQGAVSHAFGQSSA